MKPRPNGYIRLSADYAYAPLRVGLSLMQLSTGREVYFQPGDDESAIRETIDALQECPAQIVDHVAHCALGDYFHG
jgi:hypothetical protein